MAATPQEIYQRYLWATLTQNADAVAEMFTVDGVLQAPLVRAGQAFPRHLEGREARRTGLAEVRPPVGRRPTPGGVGRPHGERGEVPVGDAHDRRP